MPNFNVICSKFNIPLNVPTLIYTCPNIMSHTTLDLSLLNDASLGSSVVAVGLSSDPNPGNLTTLDYFIDDILLTAGDTNSAELANVIVGKNENLIIKVTDGPGVTVRATGIEENNAAVVKAGRLAAMASTTANQQSLLFFNNLPNISYAKGFITVFNTHDTTDCLIEVWVAPNTTPTIVEKVQKKLVTAKKSVMIENVLLLPNERVYVTSSIPGTEFFFSGRIIGA